MVKFEENSTHHEDKEVLGYIGILYSKFKISLLLPKSVKPIISPSNLNFLSI